MGILAVVNQKGGVGKTTVALGLSSAAMVRGRRVLVVDMDPQANATTGLGVFDATTTIDEVLARDTPGAAADAVRSSSWEPPVGDAPDLVPSAPRLAQQEHQLATDPIGAQDRLHVALEGVAERYDDVIVDCPPSLGLLTVNGLFAADRVLIVAEPAAWSLDGVEQILRNVRRIAERRGGRPAVAGIVVNRLGRTRDAGYWHDQLRQQHGDLVLDPAITARAAVAEAAAQSIPLHLLRRDGASEAGEQFAALLRVLEPLRSVPRPVQPADRLATPTVIDLSGPMAAVAGGFTAIER
ncbi:MAG: ParA family protein [Actinobacteria bacterium]|nr:ParA family protein [Actinomycetota bacterium]